ncbi:DNA protecting protein DprA [Andreprevotia lacus DSM 23236]|jgi:DNA processing protein|uniref:DNA protecting protein DprA n=1 Tax=Andreprevotia lacus DSM 23236 TaxID=1121001 RepID=A0A1W1XXQ7_9NEIS|nr:DNA-processing protein DprA [Andreprevotia lacus]SMC28730.1 DNA protecting protein DprA [Andreprevotia lacus DSM 23236]
MPLDNDSRDWLRFSLVPGVGTRRQLALLRVFAGPAAALAAPQALLAEHLPPAALRAWCSAPAESTEISRALDWLAMPDQWLLTLADADYPRQLLDLPDPPPVLYLKGRRDLLAASAISIVGSRHATPQGIANAEAFAATLSKAGLCVISGLAAGIDAAAHRGGLEGVGATIAVVGTGLDRVYPAGNRALAHEIAANGLLISEFALGAEPKAGHFPQRNRLIAALSLGTLVVEAVLESGSLITARQAVELGREVFAIPGSIHAPQARGCHSLIKQGAKLVEAADDILHELDWQARLVPVPQPFIGTETAAAGPGDDDGVLRAMGYDPVDIDTLAGRTGLTADALCAMLFGFELAGTVAVLPGGRWQRLGK